MKKILVTGASGFLGWNLCNVIKNDFEVHGTVFTHKVENDGVKIVQVDLTNFGNVKNLFHEINPDGVIHTAAATSPNYCQQNRQETYGINVDTPVSLAEICSDYKIPFVFTSTDLVFDGFNAPYIEEDPVNPVNIYGDQKAMAEEKVLSVYPEATVCRMPLMFGEPGPAYESFFQNMIRAFNKGGEVRLFVDEFRTPVSGTKAAQGIILALDKVNGLLHLGGRERISRYDFGKLLADVLNCGNKRITACRQEDVPMSAPRAADVSLDSSKAFSLGYDPLLLHEEMKALLRNMQP